MKPYLLLFLLSSIDVLETNFKVLGPSYIELPYYNYVSEDEIVSLFTINGKYKSYTFSSIPSFNAVEEKEYILYFLTENNIIYSHPFTLKIYDDVPPIISGPNTLYFDKNNILTKNQILNLYSVYDEMDGYLSPYIYETNFDLEYKKEKYYLSIYGIDKSNNYTKKIVNIYMKHNKSIFYNSNVNITLFKNEIYSASSILFKIQDLKYIEKCEFSNIRFKNKKYIKFDKIGTFNEILELEKDGEKYEIYLNINVIEKEKNKESIINSLFNYILKLIDSLIDKIKKIFIN